MNKIIHIHSGEEVNPEFKPECFFTIKGPPAGPFDFEYNFVSPQMVIRIRSLLQFFEGVLDQIIQGVEEEEEGNNK